MSTYEEIIKLVNARRIEEAVYCVSSLEPHEIVEILSRLSSECRMKLLVHLDLEKMLDELAKLPPELVLDVASSKGVDDIVKAVEKLPVDEAADFLSKVPTKVRLEVLSLLPEERARAIAGLMKFHPETVGGVMTTMVPVYPGDLTVGEALDDFTHKVKLGLYESSHFLYVVDFSRKLIGCVELKTLLTKPRNVKLSKCAVPVRVYVTPLDDREKAAKVALTYDLLEVPVVDSDGKFLGVVTLDDLLDVLMSECSEDLLRYAGFTETVKGSYITEPPLKLALKRAPILLLLYLANTITGGIVAAFEKVIERIALLAAFMPMLADNSGNIGSQASALILRGLVTGEVKLKWRDLAIVLRKEFATSTLMLTLLLPIAFAVGFLIPFVTTRETTYSLKLAIVVACALTASCYIADMVGSFLPIVLAKIGIDPATASAPVLTSIADIITVMTYFTVATALFML